MKNLSFILIISFLIVSCAEKSTPPTFDKELISSKTLIEEIESNEDGAFSTQGITQQKLIAHLIQLAKDGNIKAYQNAGPWGEDLLAVSGSDIDDALTISEEVENDGTFEIVTKPMKKTDFGAIGFKEEWQWDDQTLQLKKDVRQIVLTQLVRDEDSLITGERRVLTFDLRKGE
ncbi:MAG: hypothetical protein ACJAUV_000947 [Flavobacteriales bacterium]|jgi:hypothetical protein